MRKNYFTLVVLLLVVLYLSACGDGGTITLGKSYDASKKEVTDISKSFTGKDKMYFSVETSKQFDASKITLKWFKITDSGESIAFSEDCDASPDWKTSRTNWDVSTLKNKLGGNGKYKISVIIKDKVIASEMFTLE